MKKTLLTLSFAAVTLATAYAAIPDGGWSVTPKPGATVDKITEISVSKSNEHYMDPYVNRSVKINGEAIAITQKVTNSGGTVVMTLATPVEKSGTYEIVVPERTFTYGYDFYGDSEDDNPEMSWTVTVDNPDQPVGPVIPDVTVSADPISGSTLKALDAVTVTFDGAATVAAKADATVGATVTSLGSAMDVALSFAPADAANAIVMNISPAIAVSGEYTVTIPEGVLSLTSADGTAFDAPEVKLNYTVKAPPAVGEKFVVDKIHYIVLSREPLTAAVTWPNVEDDYAALTTVPLSVTLDDETFAVTEIGKLAFSEVHGLTDFVVPEGITAIGEGAFWLSSLETISIPASVTRIDGSAFEECKSLKSFDLPVTATELGEDILYGCASLKDVTLHEGLAAIPNGLLAGCVALEEVAIPSTVKSIGEFALSECSVLTKTNIPDGVTTLGRFAFAKCPLLTKLEVPESVTEMGHGVFYETGLTEASLPENLTVIPDGTFQCCTALKEFVVGPNVTEIEKEAFYWCFGLTKITFGEKVATLGTDLFKGDEAIIEVICLGNEPATGAEFPQAVYDNAILTVPESAVDAYRAAPGWKEFTNINSSSAVGENIVAENASYTINGNTLNIVADSNVTVSDANGRVIYNGATGSVSLTPGTLYLLTVNGKTAKIIL